MKDASPCCLIPPAEAGVDKSGRTGVIMGGAVVVDAVPAVDGNKGGRPIAVAVVVEAVVDDRPGVAVLVHGRPVVVDVAVVMFPLANSCCCPSDSKMCFFARSQSACIRCSNCD